MEGIAEIGNTVTMTKVIFEKYTSHVTEKAATAAVSAYRAIQLAERVLNVAEVAQQENCSQGTVRKWIKEGVIIGRTTVKLKASRKGDRGLLILGADLQAFKEIKNK